MLRGSSGDIPLTWGLFIFMSEWERPTACPASPSTRKAKKFPSPCSTLIFSGLPVTSSRTSKKAVQICSKASVVSWSQYMRATVSPTVSVVKECYYSEAQIETPLRLTHVQPRVPNYHFPFIPLAPGSFVGIVMERCINCMHLLGQMREHSDDHLDAGRVRNSMNISLVLA
jgi:hypothetical protein